MVTPDKSRKDKQIVEEQTTPEVNNAAILSEAIEKLDKEIFFTAGAAKSKTIATQKKKLEAEMLPIYQEINKAISQGEYTTFLKLTKEQRSFLENKNFRISCNMSETVAGKTILSCNIYWN